MPEMSLLKEVMYVLLAAFLIIIVIGACSNLTKNIMTPNEKLQAEATLNNLNNFLSDLTEGSSGIFLVYSPKDYYLASYPKGSNSPSECYQKNCVCICSKDDCSDTEERTCKEISKTAEFKTMKIKVNSLKVSSFPEKYLFEATIFDTSEEAVDVGPECSGEIVDIGQGFQLSESAKLKFDKAKEIASAQGITLKITSAYRTYKKQKELWDASKDSNAVCNPDSKNGICPHMTGCAIDVCFGDICKESSADLKNADTINLEKIMSDAGFVRYYKEYWHFEYGTSRWIACTNAKVTAC
jgi:LAS superfamily LD-carboxypeptidase LdcB